MGTRSSAAALLKPVVSAEERKITAERNKKAAVVRLLGPINSYLTGIGLAPLKTRGVRTDGYRLLSVVTHYPCFNYTIVQFNAIGPNGPVIGEDGILTPIPYFLKFQMNGVAQKGCVLLVVVEDEETGEEYLAFVRQHRAGTLVAMGDGFLTEAARGNPVSVKVESLLEGRIARSQIALDKPAQRTLQAPQEGEPVTSHPLGLLGRELHILAAHSAIKIKSLSRLSDDIGIFEDSSMSVAANDFWCLRVRARIKDAQTIRGDRKVGIRIHSVEDVMLNAEKLDIRDGFTLTAIQLYLREKYKNDPAWLLKLALKRMGAGARVDEVMNLLRPRELPAR